jgi:PKD repeat protein
MSTLPLGAAIVNKLSARRQAVRTTATLKNVRQFRAYCCDIDSDGVMGVAKEPVIIMDLSPNPVCVDAEMSWDLTDSYAPGSTIVSWEIDFGDGNSDTDTDIGTATGTHTYDNVGTYQVVVTIQEGTGITQTSQEEVTVVDCGEPPQDWTYVSTYGEGVFFIDWTEASPVWVERNGSLSGDGLFVNSMVMRPGDERKNNQVHELWIATRGGVYMSEDGGRNWYHVTTFDQPSNAEFSDSPAATLDEIEFMHIEFDPNDKDTIYIEARRP